MMTLADVVTDSTDGGGVAIVDRGIRHDHWVEAVSTTGDGYRVVCACGWLAEFDKPSDAVTGYLSHLEPDGILIDLRG